MAYDSRRWLALSVLLLAAVMDLVDVSIVNIALPTIREDLDASASALEWTIAGYTLAFALGLITGGRLGDVYGRRRMFLLGVGGLGRTRDEGEAACDYTETWCKRGEIGDVVLSGGARVRYLRVGSGPPLLLTHTMVP